MSNTKKPLTYVRDAIVGHCYTYYGINGQCYDPTLKIGQPLGLLLSKVCENDSRQPGGREPSYMVEFTEWKGALEWDHQLALVEPVQCWT